jgi:ABC-2 type transport system permease protein
VNQVILSLLVIVFAVLVSTLYAIVNMFFPKFDYVNEAEVVKQSAGAMLGLLGGFSLIALNGIFYYFLSDVASFSMVALLMVGLNLILSIPLIYYVKTKSEYLFSKMKA